MPDIRRERNRAGALRITNLDLLVPPSRLGTVSVIPALALAWLMLRFTLAPLAAQ